ncbi:hypothetical protein WQ54_05425 [Bacillus sp. SA1-12]|uniref:DUF3221 domain-containing protein n=1 Tax=Bacillus sp. SA1-12 TaxID=1455638 RepID=UPI000625E9CA|nr:DUF3221 domain-containing protein [Bacillus sp. SA1-12]KKI93272.1 hypothetical protein WQ54_05425 [Bacillus sp. SA1-12]
MKSKCVFILLTLTSCLLIACGTNKSATPGTNEKPSTPAMQTEGFVVEKSTKAVLVVNPNLKDNDKNYGPIYFSNTPDTLEIGDKVIISFDILMESYPGQAEAKEVKVLESHKPAGADLTEAEALEKAMGSTNVNSRILSKFEYNHDTDSWIIETKDIMGDAKEIKIEDK